MGGFRFQDLDVWQRGREVVKTVFEFSVKLEQAKQYRFAEQLRSAALSITNNIAEGSGSSSDRDFQHFLNIARRSVFETASMLMIFQDCSLISPEQLSAWLVDLEVLSRKITSFSRSLNKTRP